MATTGADSHLPLGSAEQSGLGPAALRDLARLLAEGVERGVFPGAVALLARRGIVGWQHAVGQAQLVPARREMTLETIFDLASLTKILATLTVTLALADRGMLTFNAPVSSVLPEFSGEGREGVTFRHLLAHTSGLPSWRALYLRTTRRDEVLPELCRIPLAAAPGKLVEYSDPGILLLGFALERITGRRIDALVTEYLVGPLGLRDTMFTPPREIRRRCAATEAGHAYEQEKTGDEGRRFPWHREVLAGQVHDGNAYYAMEGVAGHAGLFSTAMEVASVAQQWLRPGVLFSAALARQATADQHHGAHGYPRGLGWVLHHEGTFFDALGPRSFGHTGFTGTSVALDPDEDLVIVLLTNRVHLGGNNNQILDFRPQFHAAARRALSS